MRRRLVTGIMLTLLLTGMLTLAFNTQPARASGTIYIRADGSVEPEGTPISSIDNVTYTFTDDIYDEIVVERDNIVVDGAGYTVQGTGGGDGIHLSYRSNVTIKNMEIKRFLYSIYLWHSSNIIIARNNITDSYDDGIDLWYSPNNTISGNTISDNGWCGIELRGSNNTVSGNTISNNYLDGILVHDSNDIIFGNKIIANGRFGITLGEGCSGNNISGNNITNSTYGIYLYSCSNNNINGNNITNNNHGIYIIISSDNTIWGNNITANNEAGICLWSSSNNTVSANNANNNYYGIRLLYSGGNTVSGNTANNSYVGISLYESNNNTVSGNNATNNSCDGIGLRYSGGNTVSGNNANNSSLVGIHFYESNNNTVSGNNADNNREGIRLSYSGGNTVSGNNANNGWLGISLSVSGGNTVSGNNASNNWYGIDLYGSSNNVVSGNTANNSSYVGIHFYESNNNTVSGNNATNNAQGIDLRFSNNNFIYHNNFVNNTNQVYSWGSSNTWDDGYPSGGNFWSDHVTVDDCCGENQDEPGSDGIVDEPYVIDDDNRDNYPLLEPWSPVISAATDVDPDTLNLKSRGKWIISYIQLPEGYSAGDIDATTILLNETIPPVLDPQYDFATNSSEYLTDHDNDGILERMVKFSRAEAAEYIISVLGVEYGNVNLAITGQLYDGTPFEGTCTIKVLFPGDADDDGDADFDDFAILAGCYGTGVGNPCYNPSADFDEDGRVRYDDFLILAGNYGKTAA